jgi:hypothetical protein
MASSKPSTAQEHYENLLADHYEWMFRLPFEAEQKAILDEFVGKDLTGGLAVDKKGESADSKVNQRTGSSGKTSRLRWNHPRALRT